MADHLVLISYPCDHCGAEPRRLCRTPKGRVAASAHRNRFVKANPELWVKKAAA